MALRREAWPGPPPPREEDACEFEAARLWTSSSREASSSAEVLDASLAAYRDSAGLSCACAPTRKESPAALLAPSHFCAHLVGGTPHMNCYAPCLKQLKNSMYFLVETVQCSTGDL